MGEVFFCATEDGSVGLFNKDVDDIYHSTHGAYSESYEKFLVASDFLKYIQDNDKISILDICYGIGYNSKVALNEIIKLDKIMQINIDALEYDENLIQISPFIKNQLIDNCINEFLIEKTNFSFTNSILKTIKIFFNLKGFHHINWHNILHFKRNKKN